MLITLPVKIIINLVSGFLLSLSSPGYDLWFLAWFCLVPFFILINISKKLKETLLLSFIFGFTYNINSLKWLFTLHPLNWLGLSTKESFFVSLAALFLPVFYNSLFFILFSLCMTFFREFSPYKKGIPYLLSISVLWLIIFNKISSLSFLQGFPWTLIEYSQYKNLYLIQIAECFGGLSISFLIVFFNLVLAEMFVAFFSVEKVGERYLSRKPFALEELLRPFFLLLILISSSVFYGMYSFNKNKTDIAPGVKKALILQGNLPIKATRGRHLDLNLAKQTYKDLINNGSADLIILPEGAIPTVFDSNTHSENWIKNNFNVGADVISGTYCTNEKNRFKNCALVYSGKNVSFYEKERLVPFGEYIPFYFFLPEYLKKFADFAVGEGFIKGNKNLPLNISTGRVGINICFELIFPDIVRNHVLNGANFLVNLSDLSWFNSNLLKKQFLAFAVFRAIENRKPLLIATNSGISAFVAPNGNIIKTSMLNRKMVFPVSFSPNNKITFYTKYGW